MNVPRPTIVIAAATEENAAFGDYHSVDYFVASELAGFV